MRQVVRHQLEDGLLNGIGNSGHPLGLFHQATGSVTFGSATPTFGELLSMVEAIGDADGDISRAVFVIPRDDGFGCNRTRCRYRADGSGATRAAPMAQQWNPVLTSTLILNPR